jgi:SAM-dependent methyltransferase
MPNPPATIRTFARPTCAICGSPGETLYAGLRDSFFGAPGTWDIRKCTRSDCRLVWVDPAPVPEELNKVYQAYYTHNQPEPGSKLMRKVVWSVWNSYLGVRFGYTKGVGPKWLRLLSPLALLHPGGRGELDAAAMHLPAPKGPARLLEIGSGSGVALARMQALGWQAEGVEVDPLAVKAAQARGVKVHEGDVFKPGFAGAAFDAIASTHVFEHLYDPAPVLRECYRILKPGGRLVVLTPNAESVGHTWYGRAWIGLDAPRHLNLFSRAALQRAAETAGFRIQTLDSTLRIAWVCGALSYYVRKNGRGDLGQLGRPVPLLRGFAYQLRQRLALRSDPFAGDELRLIATR